MADAATPPPRESAVIIGNFTIDKLRRGETVEVNGIALIPADDLREPPGDAGERARELMRGLTALRLEVAPEIVDDLTALVQAALQSERTAAASQIATIMNAITEERAQRAAAYNQLFDDYQKAASQARREGAEAMREACAQCCRSWIISDRAGETATKIEKRIRALATPQEKSKE